MANLIQKMRDSLNKTRKGFIAGLESVFGGSGNVEEICEELEELLISSDIGAAASQRIIAGLREAAREAKTTDASLMREMLSTQMLKILTGAAGGGAMEYPAVILVIGVNGAGKTTAVGKLTRLYQNAGKNVIVAAADTFRAAAIDQLGVWCEKNGATMIRHKENSDPAAVVFDAVKAAKARGADLLICDTAGRLQNKKNLMDELSKINRIIESQYGEAHREVYLVIDAVTGQNGLSQARVFAEAANVTGVVLTKLDGSAKGGIVIPIYSELGIPVRYVCTGEGIEDIQEFDAEVFVNCLMGSEN